MNDELDEETIGSEEGLDEFAQKGTLGDLWRNSPLVKVGVVLAAVGVIVGVLYYFGGTPEKTPDSMLPIASEVKTAPGEQAVTPAYVDAVEEQNEADLERALKTGDSTLPVPIEAPTDRLQLPEEEQDEEDPLHRWRRLQEERVQKEMEVEEPEAVTVLDSEQQNEAMKKLAESMSKQMQSILGRRAEKQKFQYVAVVKESAGGGGSAANGGLGEEGEFNGEVEEEEPEVIIPAGDIAYAQLLIEANSDVPGPVLAVLVSGPLKGSKIIGTFSVSNEYLTLNFTTVVVDGKSYDIDAVALDPDTSLPGMATEVDHRYLQRVVLPAAAAFVSGFADAMAQSDATNITIDTGSGGTTTTATDQDLNTEEEVALGVKEAGDEISDILDDMGDVEILVKIHAGTPIGVLFTEPVTEEENDSG